MKIMVLSWSMRGGAGAEKVLSRLTFALKDDIDFVCVYPKMDGFGFGEYDIPFHGKQIEVDIGWNQPIRNIPHRLSKLFYKLKELRRIIREEDPDLILSNSIHIWHHLIVALKFSRLTTKKVILRFGNPVYEDIKKYGKLYTMLMRLGMQSVDQTIVNAEGIATELKNLFQVSPTKINIINNSIPLDEIRTMSQEEMCTPPFGDDLPIILNVARLSDQKNQVLLIKAFQKVQENVEANLVIVGAGPLERELRGLVHNLDLEKKVHFLGWQDNPFKYMSKADLFVLSSNFEGFPSVIIEAMACGCAVIATDFYGSSEILDEGKYGALVPVGDQKALANEIVRMLRNEELRQMMARKGKQRANDFNIDAMTDKYARVFHQLVDQENNLGQTKQIKALN